MSDRPPQFEHSHEPTRDVSQESLPPIDDTPNSVVLGNAVPVAAPRPTPHLPALNTSNAADATEAPHESDDADLEVPEEKKHGRWLIHVIGVAAAAGWAAFWILRAEPGVSTVAPASSATTTPATQTAASSPAPALRPEREPPISGPMPVASATNFEYKSDQTAELRPLYLGKQWVSAEENVPGGVRFNQLPWSPALRLGDSVFDQGVVMLAPEKGEGLVSFRVPEGTRKFAALLGLGGSSNPAHLTRCQRDGGSVTFVVYANGIEAFRKIIVGADGWHDEVRLDIGASVKTLTLIVDNADGDNQCDAGVWIEARFLVEPATATASASGGGQ